MTEPRVIRAGYATVKGTRHVAYDAISLTPAGVRGDRRFCVIDRERSFVLRTAQTPQLMRIVARLDGDVLRLELPDGDVLEGPPGIAAEPLACDYWGRTAYVSPLEGPFGEAIARALGLRGEPERYALAEAPEGEVVYGGGVSLVTTSALDRVAALLGVPEVDPVRFRPSLVVDDRQAPLELATGETYRVGSAVLRIRGAIPRCAVVDKDGATGEKDLDVLAALTAAREPGQKEPFFGFDADVEEPAEVSAGSVMLPA